MNICHFCNKKFEGRITVIDALYCFSNWRKEFDYYQLISFRDPYINACIDCGKNYYKWKSLKTKEITKQLNYRKIKGKFLPIKLKKYDIKKEKDICVFCKKITPYLMTTPIGSRNNYKSGLGQFCSECINLL